MECFFTKFGMQIENPIKHLLRDVENETKKKQE